MKHRANQGMAIISALGFLTVVAILISAAMMIGLSTNRLSKDNVSATRAQYAAEAGIEQAISTAYTNVVHPLYEDQTNTWRPTIADYKNALDETYLVANKTLQDGDQIELSGILSDGGSYEIKIARTDKSEITADKVILSIVSKGTYGTGDKAAERVISQEIVISSLRFNGDPYAVLSNNVNCIFCHTTVTSIEAAYSNSNTPLKMNGAAGLAEQNGTNRVRVATLESLNVDRSVDSVIAGTLYTRGTTNLMTKGGMQFAGRPDANSEKLNAAALGTFNDRDCAVINDCKKDKNGTGVNFYKNYLAQGGPDGEIPSKFPLPIPDDNGNRLIDASEWQNAIANDPNKGYIKGGNKQFMETPEFGERGTSLSSIGAAQLNSSDSTRGIKGNLVIDGNVEIRGTVYVDGDVVISGKIKTGDPTKGQSGKIVARGNIYVVGDVEYDCSPKACDYSKPETLPQFAMVAGGNMLVGNYMTTASGDQSWTQTYEQCGGTGTKTVKETQMQTQTVTESWYQIQSRTRTRTKSSSGSFGSWSGYSGWSNIGNASASALSAPGTSKSPSDSATPNRGVQTETSYRVTRVNVSVTKEVPVQVDITKTYDKRCGYTRGTVSDDGTKYANEYFNDSLTNSTSESPESVDPGKYLPFIDPEETNLATWQQDILKEYFGTVPAANSPQRRSYARATWMKGDEKGIASGCDVDINGCGNYRTRGSFTANEMAAFNQREYCKAQSDTNKRQGCSNIGVSYESGYKPRFYRLREGAGIYRCANYDASECRSYGDPTNGNNQSNSSYYVGANYTEITSDDLNALGAFDTIYDLSPTANWLANGDDERDSERVLKGMWTNKMESGSRSTKALQIDGTMYSANAVFTIAPARSRSNGSITVNGSLISADLGVLAVGSSGQMWNAFQTNANSNENSGLRIHYDRRLNGLIGLKGTGQEGIILTRSNYEQKKLGDF